MSEESAFWDKIAEKYAASPIKDMDAYLKTMDRTKAHLSEQDSILEVGCGTGSTALLLADRVSHITAADISANMIDIGKRKARDQEVENVTFVRAALPDQTLEPESFDAVLAFNILHLVKDLPAVVRNLRDALKPGGLFISKSACIANRTRLWAVPLFFLRLAGFAPYVNLLTTAELEAAISDAGFELVETGLYPSPRNRFIVARKV